jgi:hypothetical protein
MKYTKEQLINMGSEKIRNDAGLFSLFKQYVEEDICELYHDCKLPNNCFGCSFNTTFGRWRTYVLNNSKTIKRKIMSNSKSTYELKDERLRLFFDEKILDKNSSDEEWNTWINYPAEPEKVKERKAFFAKLPNSSADAKEPKPKASNRKGKGKPTASAQEGAKEPSTDADSKEGDENKENENNDSK